MSFYDITKEDLLNEHLNERKIIKAWKIECPLTEIKDYFLIKIQNQVVAIPRIVSKTLIAALLTIKPTDRIRIYHGEIESGTFKKNDPISNSLFYTSNNRIRVDNNIEEGYLVTSHKEIKLRFKNGNDVDAKFLMIDSYKRRYDNGYGNFFRVDDIIKIEFSNKGKGGIIWKHPLFKEEYFNKYRENNNTKELDPIQVGSVNDDCCSDY
jgi:hypothetical protein